MRYRRETPRAATTTGESEDIGEPIFEAPEREPADDNRDQGEPDRVINVSGRPIAIEQDGTPGFDQRSQRVEFGDPGVFIRHFLGGVDDRRRVEEQVKQDLDDVLEIAEIDRGAGNE